MELACMVIIGCNAAYGTERIVIVNLAVITVLSFYTSHTSGPLIGNFAPCVYMYIFAGVTNDVNTNRPNEAY